MTAADLDAGDPRSGVIRGHKVRRQTAQRFSQHNGCAAMQHAERLLRTLIHRHFTTEEIGPNGSNPDAEHPLNPVLYLTV